MARSIGSSEYDDGNTIQAKIFNFIFTSLSITILKFDDGNNDHKTVTYKILFLEATNVEKLQLLSL